MRLSIVMLIVFILLSVIIDVLVYKKLSGIKKCRWLKTVYLLFSVIVYLLMVSVWLSADDMSNSLRLQFVMWSIFVSALSFLPKLIYAIFFVLSKIPRLFGKKHWRILPYAGIALSGVVFIVLLWSAFITPYQFNVNEIDFESEKIPESFSGYKIVQFSDLHAGTYGNRTRIVRKLVDEINALNPDLIVFTGDIVSLQTDELVPFIGELKNLKAKDGIISILGNHDYGDYVRWKSESNKKANLQRLIDIQRDELKWKLLLNQHVYLKNGNDSILIVGVENWGEPPFKTYGNLDMAMPVGGDDNCFKLLLSHNPKHWEAKVLRATDIDLTLCGHTHAMQAMINLFGKKYSLSALRYKHWQGMSVENGQSVYVNIGIGEVGVPMRIGATPEITVFTLKHKN